MLSTLLFVTVGPNSGDDIVIMFFFKKKIVRTRSGERSPRRHQGHEVDAGGLPGACPFARASREPLGLKMQPWRRQDDRMTGGAAATST